jgi:fused signal recognition particle receptor
VDVGGRTGLWARIRDGLRRTRQAIAAHLQDAFTRPVDEAFFERLEEALLASDVGVEVTGEVVEELRRRVRAGLRGPEEVRGALREVLRGFLPQPQPLQLEPPPAVVLVVGVNGSGKTTTAGKLACHLTGLGKRVVLAAADTFRAAAIDQLEVWARRAGAELVRHREGSDPAAVVHDAAQAAVARHADVLVADTAGRLHTKVNLMEELRKVRRVLARQLPQSAWESLLVLDATTGQNALQQARQFQDAAAATGVVLTKLDSSAKGGVVLAIGRQLGLPVKLVGTGEGPEDLEPFDPDSFVDALLPEA